MYGCLSRTWGLWAVWGSVTRVWHRWGPNLGSSPSDSRPLTDFSLSVSPSFFILFDSPHSFQVLPAVPSTTLAWLNPKISVITMGPSQPRWYYLVLERLPGLIPRECGTFYLWIWYVQTHLNWGSAPDRVDRWDKNKFPLFLSPSPTIQSVSQPINIHWAPTACLALFQALETQCWTEEISTSMFVELPF